MTVRTCVAAVFDKREFGVRWTKHVVMVQVDGRVKRFESHISMMLVDVLTTVDD
jgi:hypothetical protein